METITLAPEQTLGERIANAVKAVEHLYNYLEERIDRPEVTSKVGEMVEYLDSL